MRFPLCLAATILLVMLPARASATEARSLSLFAGSTSLLVTRSATPIVAGTQVEWAYSPSLGLGVELREPIAQSRLSFGLQWISSHFQDDTPPQVLSPQGAMVEYQGREHSFQSVAAILSASLLHAGPVEIHADVGVAYQRSRSSTTMAWSSLDEEWISIEGVVRNLPAMQAGGMLAWELREGYALALRLVVQGSIESKPNSERDEWVWVGGGIRVGL